jgi:hypothetical protein
MSRNTPRGTFSPNPPLPFVEFFQRSKEDLFAVILTEIQKSKRSINTK